MKERTATPPSKGSGSDDSEPRAKLGSRLQAKLASAEGVGATAKSGSGSVKVSRPPGGRGPRRARLHLTRIDPWSVMKAAFLLSVALGIVVFVAVSILWSVVSAAGLWSSINDTLAPFVETEGGPPSTSATTWALAASSASRSWSRC